MCTFLLLCFRKVKISFRINVSTAGFLYYSMKLLDFYLNSLQSFPLFVMKSCSQYFFFKLLYVRYMPSVCVCLLRKVDGL